MGRRTRRKRTEPRRARRFVSQSRRAVVVAVAALLVGGPIALVARPSAAAVEGQNIQDGNNDSRSTQGGSSETGDAIGGQIVGVTGGGDVRIDATNRAEDVDARSGDANASNEIDAIVGNVVEGAGCPGVSDVGAADCPGTTGVGNGIHGDSFVAAIIHDGDNEQRIDQDADASTGDAVSGGQVIGVVGGGTVAIVADNRAEDADATSGDATAKNKLDDVEASNEVEFAGCCDVPALEDITADSLHSTIVHEGDDEQDINGSATASSGDALSGYQVIGVASEAGGRIAIDATNRAEDTDAESGNAEATNLVGLAASGDAVLNAPPCCSGADAADIEADTINAAIVHEGDDEQSLDQDADASTGDAASGGQTVGAVGGGNVDITLDNSAEDTDATSGDAEAHNRTDLATPSDVVIFATCGGCPLPFPVPGGADISATSLDATIVHEGDDRQSLDQSASASSGDALSGYQVVSAVGSAGGRIAIDATNHAEDTDARSGEGVAENFVGLAASGDAAEDVPGGCCGFADAADIHADTIDAVIVHEGDDEQSIDQDADASTGDALSGGQTVGAIGAGDIAITLDNRAEDTDARSGDAEAHNRILDAEASDFVSFAPAGCCVIPMDIRATTINAVIVHEGDDEQTIDQAAEASSGDAVSGAQVVGALGGGAVSIDATNRAEDTDARSGDGHADNTVTEAVSGDVVENFSDGVPPQDISATNIATVVAHDGDNEQDVDQHSSASTGDAIAGGQVIGGVSSGAVDLALDNQSSDVDVTSGNARDDQSAKQDVGDRVDFTPAEVAARAAVPGALAVGLAAMSLVLIARRRRVHR